MYKFFKEFLADDIHFRDVWQFEMKSDFTPLQGIKESKFTQEFYIFIPKSLKINNETYTRANFYRDQSNWIRYKTPVMTLEKVMELDNKDSPVYRIHQTLKDAINEAQAKEVEFEIKLFGNIVRSALRRWLNSILDQMDSVEEKDKNKSINDINHFCDQIIKLRHFSTDFKTNLLQQTDHPIIYTSYGYIDEFISKTIDYYLCGLLARLREDKDPEFKKVDEEICGILSRENKYRIKEYAESNVLNGSKVAPEFVLYRNSLLNKYVIGALSLSLNRSSASTMFQNVMGGLAAGFAMLIYLVLLLFWQGNILLINSYPFVMITVILYILKDRLKEWIKSVSVQQSFKWFPDYQTDIKSEDDEIVLGSLKESFAIVEEDKLPQTIKNIRNKEFHQILSMFSRPENVVYYKKTITMKSHGFTDPSKHYGLNILFRFDIHHFLNKAGNPKQSYLTLVPGTKKLTMIMLPKIYHLNIIMKKTYMSNQGVPTTEFKKFRLIVDKDGIKKIEKVYFLPVKS